MKRLEIRFIPISDEDPQPRAASPREPFCLVDAKSCQDPTLKANYVAPACFTQRMIST